MVRIKRILPLLAVLLALVAHGAKASLIGDQVTCHFKTIGLFNIDDTCSTIFNLYSPVPATVGAGIEFFPGGKFGDSEPYYFYAGAVVDVGADFIQFQPYNDVTGYLGSFFLDIGSLDWMGEPDRVISGVHASGVNVDLSALSVTFTDHSVRIALENTRMPRDSLVNVRLITSQSVPVPTPLTLSVLGFGILLLHRRITRRGAKLQIG